MARAERPLGRHFRRHIAPSSLSVQRSSTGRGSRAVGMVGRRGTDHPSFLSPRWPRDDRHRRGVRVCRRCAPRQRAFGSLAPLTPFSCARHRIRLHRRRGDGRPGRGGGGDRGPRAGDRVRDAPRRTGTLGDAHRGVLRGRYTGLRGAALLIARQGGASLAFDMISPSAISPGAVLAATAGAALFAGLYPFVPWRYQPAQALAAAEREPLRGLLAMPAGVAASILLLRVLGATNIDLSNLGLPLIGLMPRLVTLGFVLVAFALRARARGRASRSGIITTILPAPVLAGWDER